MSSARLGRWVLFGTILVVACKSPDESGRVAGDDLQDTGEPGSGLVTMRQALEADVLPQDALPEFVLSPHQPEPDELAAKFEALFASEGVSAWENLSPAAKQQLLATMALAPPRPLPPTAPEIVAADKIRYEQYEQTMAAAADLSPEEQAKLKETIVGGGKP